MHTIWREKQPSINKKGGHKGRGVFSFKIKTVVGGRNTQKFKFSACLYFLMTFMIFKRPFIFGSQNFFHVVNEKDHSFNCTV